MLSFPLNTANNSPWSGESVMAPITSALPVLSLLDVPAAMAVPCFVVAMSWVVAIGALAVVVGRSYTRSQFSTSFPVKVSGRGVGRRYGDRQRSCGRGKGVTTALCVCLLRSTERYEV